MIVSTVVNLSSVITLFIALLKIKRWIQKEYTGIRTWHWSVDGLFAIYLILFFMLFAVELAMTVELYMIDISDFNEKFA